MDQTTPTKKSYPLATPEVAKMFGLAEHSGEAFSSPVVSAAHIPDPASKKEDFTQIAGNLFMKAPKVQPHVDLTKTGLVSHVDTASALHTLPVIVHDSEQTTAGKLSGFLKNVTPYVVVFSAALFVYFYFFGSSFSFANLFKTQTKAQTAKESQLAQLEQQNLVSYQQWVNQFYFEVTDEKVTDPNVDNSGNGLTNFQKYLLNLNPKAYDTLGLGMADSQALENGINPLTGLPLNDDQKAIINNYFDFEVISNRLTLESLQNKSQVAGASISVNTVNPMTAQTAQAAGYNNVAGPEELGSSLDIDTTTPGRLQIPSLKIDAPLIWSQDSNSFDKDLENGVIHYPGTAMPGQMGTTYISGHSSNYVWAKGSYNHIFTQLDKLADNTSFTITVKTKNGKTSVLHYVVTSRQQYDPKDQAQFQNGGKSVVALSTCWPVGSTKYRLVVFGELTQVENQ